MHLRYEVAFFQNLTTLILALGYYLSPFPVNLSAYNILNSKSKIISLQFSCLSCSSIPGRFFSNPPLYLLWVWGRQWWFHPHSWW